MGTIREPSPVLLILAAFSQHAEALRWARDQAESTWGSVALQSDAFAFAETDYYDATMGQGLKKQFLAMATLIDPAQLAAIKRLTNDWEQQYAVHRPGDRPRPLNLDPGYLTSAKLVLASTKDHAHRLYLAQGIYAEVTLQYQQKAWHALPWTFPDYRRGDYHAFFSQCRAFLRAARPSCWPN